MQKSIAIPLHEIVIKITKPTSPSYTAIISEPMHVGANNNIVTSKLLGIKLREFDWEYLEVWLW